MWHFDFVSVNPLFCVCVCATLVPTNPQHRGIPPASSDGQHVEIVHSAGSACRLPARVFEQFRGRLPSKTGEPREQRLTGGVVQIPRSRQALCQPHHQAEVSQGRCKNSLETETCICIFI